MMILWLNIESDYFLRDVRVQPSDPKLSNTNR